MEDYVRKRITSIDALRAITLLGIIIVHTKEGFGFLIDGDKNTIDNIIRVFIDLFLKHKCNTIFSILFGVSFYLILRNPSYTSSKFAWRCVLLIGIGLVNKVFYTYDALMWYGMCGICLVPIRHWKTNNIFCLFLLLWMIKPLLSQYSFGDYLFGIGTNHRYTDYFNNPVAYYFYPYAAVDYLRIVLNGSVVGTYSWFVLGYGMSRAGIIENLEKNVTIQTLSIFWFLYILSFMGVHFHVFDHKLLIKYTTSIQILAATIAYASTLIYLYNCSLFHKALSFLESYGKLGLTNYSMQGVIGVLLIADFGFGMRHFHFSIILITFIIFYIIQAIFSHFWIKKYRYGPMEYLWRVATERKYIPLKR